MIITRSKFLSNATHSWAIWRWGVLFPARWSTSPLPSWCESLSYENLPNRWIGQRGNIEFPPRSPDLTPLDFFYGDTSKIRFIAQNLQQSMSWEQQLKENAPKHQMKWFVMFAIPSVRIISSACTRTVISSKTCNNLKDSTLVFFNLDYNT